MIQWINRLLLLGALAYAVYWGIGWVERREEVRYQAREEMVRQVAEQKAAEVQRAVEHGSAIRTDALRQQLDQAQHRRSEQAVGAH